MDRLRYGYAHLTSSYISSLSHLRSRDIPMRDWASTSVAFSGIETLSICPSYADLTRTAHSIRSSESNTTNLPLEISLRACPALPIRWSPLAIDLGDPIWTTRSTYPISIPNSRLVDEITTSISPALSFSSTSSLISLDKEPWCAANFSIPLSFSCMEMDSVPALVLVKIRVVR